MLATYKHNRFVKYGLCSKLVRLSRPLKVTDNRKGASLLQNVYIFRKLRVRILIVQAPGGKK